MKNQNYGDDTEEFPEYSLADIMELLKIDEKTTRKLIKKAGIEIELSKSDPNEVISYEDYRKLWVSRANRREGRLLATLLVEECVNWWTKMLGKK
jgi:hypothetical protein